MRQIEEALNTITKHPDIAFFAGPRNLDLVARAEEALGGSFPPSYRSFILQLGAGSFGAFEVYGVVNEDFQNSAVPDGVWLTLRERANETVSGGTILIGSTGDGGYSALQLGDEGGAVSLIWPGSQAAEIVSDDFGSFLLEGVRHQL